MKGKFNTSKETKEKFKKYKQGTQNYKKEHNSCEKTKNNFQK